MAKITLILDTRASEAGKPSPIKVRISHLRQEVYIASGISVLPEQWDAINSSVVVHPRRREYNHQLSLLKSYIDDYIFDLRRSGKLGLMSAKDIKKGYIAQRRADNDLAEEQQVFFVDYFAFVRDAQRSDGSKSIYDQTLSRLKAFDELLFERKLADIDYKYIVAFDKFLATTNSQNSRNVYHRTIRTVINRAIDEGITTVYPYRKHKLRQEITRDKALSIDEVRALFSYPCEPWQQEYVDMFKLAFFFIGINAVDLLHLTSIVSGRIDYKRRKTGKHYSIKVLKEAQAIIDKYRGRNQLLSPLDRYGNYKDYLHHLNDALKTIGLRYTGRKPEGKALFPNLSLGYARTTWATIASELDIPRETISAALGHWVVDVTATYIRLDMRKKIDAANRAVVDYVLYDKRG